MKRIIPTLFFFSFCLVAAQIQTAPEGFFRLDSDLRFTKFITKSTCYALGANSTILRSDDRGVTWQQQYAPGFELLNGVDFSDEVTGFVVGSNGTLLKTNDGGKKWKEAISITQKTLIAVSAKGNHVIAVGSEGTILTSSDNGDTWTPSSSGVTQNLTSVLLLSNGNAIAAGASGILLRSTDDGASWNKIDNPSKTTFTARNFSVLPSGEIILLFSATAETSILLTTTDEGLNWTWKELKIRAYSHSFPKDTATGWFAKDNQLDLFRTKNGGGTVEKVNNFDSTLMAAGVPAVSVSFTDEMNGVAVGFRKVIYTTDDGGNSWTLRSFLWAPTNTSPFYTLTFLNDTIGWAGCNNEKIFRTRNGGATWLPQRDLDLMGDFGHIISGINFNDENNGFAVSNRMNGFLKTSDGGINWNEVKSTPGFLGGGYVSAINQTDIVVFPAYDGTYLQTSDNGGQTWNRKQIVPNSGFIASGGYTKGRDTIGYLILAMPTDNPSYVIHKRSIDKGNSYNELPLPLLPQGKGVGVGIPEFISSDTAYAIGGITQENYNKIGLILKSIDGGTTWMIQDSATVPSINKLKIKVNKGYAIGLNGNIIKTTDRGKTWQTIQNKGLTRQMFDIAMPSEDVTYIASDQNMLLKSIPADALVTSVQESTETAHEAPILDMYMKEIYPNPVRSDVTLKLYYSLAMKRNDIKLSVYSMTGEKVADITENFRQSTGNNPALVQWNTQGVPGGMYIIEAKGGNAQMAIPVVIAR